MTELINSDVSVSTGLPLAIKAEGLSKLYGSVKACDQVDLELSRGEIHGILGENGAGKSTLMKMLIGLVLPDSGSISVDGETVTIKDPLDAADLGIGMVHQHFSLVEELTVWENVSLGGNEKLDRSKIRNKVSDLSHEYGLEVDPDHLVGNLPVGMRQRVELIKCLQRDPSVLILDEPTSVLTPKESEQLFESLRKVVSEKNRAVALVSHRLAEILQATDRITIMRNGAVIDRSLTKDTDENALALGMVGREVDLNFTKVSSEAKELQDSSAVDDAELQEQFILEFKEIKTTGNSGAKELDGFSLGLRSGEIFGLVGVEGNGQSSLVEVLSGLRKIDSGQVFLRGKELSAKGLGGLTEGGVAVIPEDRHDSGVVLGMSVADNLVFSNLGEVYRFGVLNKKKRDSKALDLIEEFGISCAGPDAPLWSLSGGNQQRVVLARETSGNPVVLIASQPTRGLDVGAIEYMTRHLRDLADNGLSVLLISNELDEIFSISDRIGVLFRGQLVASMNCKDADREEIGLLMGRGKI